MLTHWQQGAMCWPMLQICWQIVHMPMEFAYMLRLTEKWPLSKHTPLLCPCLLCLCEWSGEFNLEKWIQTPGPWAFVGYPWGWGNEGFRALGYHANFWRRVYEHVSRKWKEMHPEPMQLWHLSNVLSWRPMTGMLSYRRPREMFPHLWDTLLGLPARGRAGSRADNILYKNKVWYIM